MRPMSESENAAVRELVALLDWLRDKLERFRRDASDPYDRATLHALVRACDPGSNPRLATSLAARDARSLEARKAKKEERLMSPTNGVESIPAIAPRVRTRPEPRSASAKPGVLTTEFWSVVGVLAASLTTALQADEASVRIAALIAMACLGSVLGGLYIWSRTRVKTSSTGEGGDA